MSHIMKPANKAIAAFVDSVPTHGRQPARI